MANFTGQNMEVRMNGGSKSEIVVKFGGRECECKIKVCSTWKEEQR